ncbi:MAG TPA: hypothetical protein VGM23_13815 [Armatimonadota bacterium]|jgi:Tol biopolymer transport system component
MNEPHGSPLRPLLFGLLGLVVGMGIGYALFTFTPQCRERLQEAQRAAESGAPTPLAAPASTAQERIFFIGSQGEKDGIYVINPDGSDRRFLVETPDMLHDQQFSISRDGRHLAYLGPKDTISVMQTDGSGKRLLVPHSDWAVYDPAISPDGTLVVFPRDDGLYRIDADGSNLQRLTITKKDYIDIAPQFSPDGRQVAFLRAVASSDAGGDLLIVDLDSRVERKLNGPGYSGTPLWSSNGRYVLSYWIVEGEDEGGFSVLDTRGKDIVHVDHALYPAFSPTDDLIAYHNCVSDTPGVNFMQADSSGKQPLSNAKHADSQPVFSPDGQRLLVTQWDDQGNSTIYLLNKDGSGRKELTKGHHPQWVR